ncbi:DUF2357 domain-containing protein [Peribacillus sp. ACCC06369]|uniref:DUF2357 domain-containing protein n=1 Tax=Peribacillus sp. ACCC06369 TaxID=3055860 RepID=UPI0025A0DB17|nr:DUF2357 domain-containing protein [Peribacillus sp. ACCC06369]MDM5360420.1 DUF2357 domain-containing protein [Peribacillus sp. ACCC06369]
MTKQNIKYFKNNHVIIYPSVFAESIDASNVKTPFENCDNEILQYDESLNELFLEEVTSYTVETLDDTTFVKNDFKSIGIYVSKSTGLLKYVNYLGAATFRGLKLNIVSQKLSEEAVQSVISDIQKSYLDLVYDYHNPTALKTRNTKRNQVSIEYHKLKLILGMLEHRRPEKNIYKIMERILNKPFQSYYKQERTVSAHDSFSFGDLDMSRMVSGRNEYYPIRPTQLQNSKLVNSFYIHTGKRILPMYYTLNETLDTFDSHENRFIKYFLTLLIDYLKKLDKMVTQKGIFGYNKTLKQSIQLHEKKLSHIVTSSFFRKIAPLTMIPYQSQVLNKREGYRELFHYYNILSTQQELVFDDEIDNLIDSKRIDKLYELWCFFKVVDVFKQINHGLYEENITLTVNKERILFSEKNENCYYTFTNFLGLNLDIKVHFQKFFSGSDTYTLKYDPDITVEFLKNGTLYFRVFFDAKYRVEFDKNEVGKFKPDDINKMHAYIDAIYYSKGAYILYPGDVEKIFPVNPKNILPGVGALCLKPINNGDKLKLVTFITNIINELK